MSEEAADMRTAIVVGAGVVGTACAHYLRQDGWQVTALDKTAAPSGCSYGNCGYVSPSHVLPLCEPGAVGRTLKEMRQPNAPIKIRPGLSLRRWRWLIRFARNCNAAQMHHGAAALHALLASSRKLYSQLVREENLNCQFSERGLLMVYRSRQAWEAFQSTNALLTERYDTPAERLDADQVRELEPALNDSVVGAWHYRGDAHLRPDQLMHAWHGVLKERGVSFRFGCSVERIDVLDSHRVRVITPQTAIEANLVVLAGGALTPNLEETLGTVLPIEPGKGYSITFANPVDGPRMPMLIPEAHVGITPWQDGLRLGSMMEIVGFDTSLAEKRLDVLRRGADSVLQCQLDYREPQRWFGWRPMTPDSVPFIGRAPKSERILVAAGHNMLGLSMAPATGKLIAELAAGRETHLDIEPYRLER